jgi:hypothetical protein
MDISKVHEIHLSIIPLSGVLIASLRAQQRSRQAPNYVSLHLWYHTVMLALENGASDNGSATTSAPSAKAQDHAETIADITSACGVLDPEPYISLPFICQPWFSAGVTLMRGKLYISSESLSKSSNRTLAAAQSSLPRIYILVKELNWRNYRLLSQTSKTIGSGPASYPVYSTSESKEFIKLAFCAESRLQGCRSTWRAGLYLTSIASGVCICSWHPRLEADIELRCGRSLFVYPAHLAT